MLGRATQTISAILVDDEPLACDELAYLLKKYEDFEIAGVAHNGLEAIKLIEETEPDVVFLDVQMPGKGGLCDPGTTQADDPASPLYPCDGV